MNHRLRAVGGRVVFDPDVWFVYRPRESPSALFRQYWTFGRWKAVVIIRDPGSLRPRQLAPLALFATLAGAVAPSPIRGPANSHSPPMEPSSPGLRQPPTAVGEPLGPAPHSWGLGRWLSDGVARARLNLEPERGTSRAADRLGLGERDVSEPVVLCYHAVSDSWNDPLAMPPARLRNQVRGLLARGFRPARADQTLANSGRLLHVTFDDAFSNVSDAVILRDLGVPRRSSPARATRISRVRSPCRRWRPGLSGSNPRPRQWTGRRSRPSFVRTSRSVLHRHPSPSHAPDRQGA